MLNDDVRCLVVVGAQWGDEGKGKIIDVLAKDADWIARYQGGANAGHTVHVAQPSPGCRPKSHRHGFGL